MLKIKYESLETDFEKYMDIVCNNEETVVIDSEKGNVVMISEKAYKDMIESIGTEQSADR